MIVLNWTAGYEETETPYVEGAPSWQDIVIRVNGVEVARQTVVWTRYRDQPEPDMYDVMSILKDLFRWERPS